MSATITRPLHATAPSAHRAIGVARASRLALLAPLLVLAGGALLVLGAWLPWLTLFAGLQEYRGIEGLNGRLFLLAGVAALPVGVVMLRRPVTPLRWIPGTLGAAALGLAAWVGAGLVALVREQQANPMMLAGYGTGMPVVLAGALLLVLASLVPRGAR